jgi:hypothetical protein
MNQADILKLAKEAGFKVGQKHGIIFEKDNCSLDTEYEIERFAELVAQHEREACAKRIEPKNDRDDWTEFAYQCDVLAKIIRNRKDNHEQ